MKKRVLITGANGLLGQKLVQVLAEEYQVLATARQPEPVISVEGIQYLPLDITDMSRCKELTMEFKPDVILNAAAFTHVDACEEQKELCWKVNVKGVENLALCARKNMAQLVHFSTDYIFKGTDGPYPEEAYPEPLGYYGKAKLASENVVRMAGIPYAIIRTNVLYGIGVGVKTNFFLWVYKNLSSGKPIRVVTDQYNNPILAEDLAEGVRLLLQKSGYGVFHMGGEEYLNRFDFAIKIAEIFSFSRDLIQPITTDALGQKAPRPMQGGLKIEKAKKELGFQPRTIPEALEYLRTQLKER
ncbi:MAG: dTDP-4-dehydrorhamnose reductase [Calditrichaeota bacterium]|nr:MAG: dTDP-4-dehydrorhamnose reductase [Calditrichota bacterium]